MSAIRRSLGPAIACLFLLAPATHAQSGEIATARGPAEVPRDPRPLAVFDIPAVDTLAALGVIPDAVPGNLYVDYLGAVGDAAEPVGTLFEPDLEALAALGPALILAGGRSSTQVDSLDRVAPTLDMTIDDADLIADARQRITDYGALFGREAEAEVLLDTFDAKLAEAREAAEDEGRALIVMTNGPKLSAFGQGSRFGWIHSDLGLAEAKDDVQAAGHGDAVSFEFIADTNPDWLIVIDRGAAIGAEGASARETLANPLVETTRAWQEGQVIYLNPDLYIAGGGYSTMIATLDQLIAAFSD